MTFALIHHETLITGVQSLYAFAAIGGWTAIGYAVIRFWRRKK